MAGRVPRPPASSVRPRSADLEVEVGPLSSRAELSRIPRRVPLGGGWALVVLDPPALCPLTSPGHTATSEQVLGARCPGPARLPVCQSREKTAHAITRECLGSWQPEFPCCQSSESGFQGSRGVVQRRSGVHNRCSAARQVVLHRVQGNPGRVGSSVSGGSDPAPSVSVCVSAAASDPGMG